MKIHPAHVPYGCILFFVSCAAIYSAPAPDGSSPRSATISGRVVNEVTGRYLNNARVTAREAHLQAFTDESGSYRIANVPSGPVTLEVLYTGLEKQELSVNVLPGQNVTRNVNLSPPGGAAVKMDPFQVESTRVTDQATIAVNEQRFSPNLKTVVSTGDLSEHGDGNIAEWLKFLPGISGEHTPRGDIGEISVRGFPTNLTMITQDGADAANAPYAGNTRSMDLKTTMSISNLARVEVTKVPTPSTGADTMAGSVNLISRSAFEAARREFRYTATINGEHTGIWDALQGKKTYSIWGHDKILHAWPALNFTFTDPVSERFGYTIAGMYNQTAQPHQSRNMRWGTNSGQYGASFGNPVNTSHLERKAGSMLWRRHLDGTADWRVTRNSVLSAGVRVFSSEESSAQNGGYWIEVGPGTNPNPTVPGGVPGRYGSDFTIGATGRGTYNLQDNNHILFRDGLSGNLRYRFDNGDWKVELKTSRSSANLRFRSTPEEGGFRSLRMDSTIPLRVEFHDINRIGGAGKILVFDNNGTPLDPSRAEFWINNSRVASATALKFDVTDEVATYNADIRKALHAFAIPAAIQIGGARKTKERDTRNQANYVYSYRGPNGDRTPAEFLTPPLDFFYAGSHVAASPYRAAQAYNSNPDLFFEAPADRVRRELGRIQRSERIREDVDALYLQAEAGLFENRLKALVGVRYERTTVNGIGALNTPNAIWQRNPDGSFVRDGSGRRVRIPGAGASGSLEELPFLWQERAAHSRRTYDGYYPSVHLTYNFTEKLQARAAFAQTYGRPNFDQIIPLVTVNEFTDADDVVTGGRLSMRNPGLLPWAANNYDLTTEYYTDHAGVFSAGVFRKDVVNFFGSLTRPSTPQELEEAGVADLLGGWETVTSYNLGEVRVDGVELSFNQRLALLDPWLAGWGSAFRVFANYTKIRVTGARTNLRGFQPRSANWGLQFARKQVRAALKWNSTADRPTDDVTGIGRNGQQYDQGMLIMDVSLSYSLRPNLAFFLDMKNVGRTIRVQGRKSDELPDYAWIWNHNRHLGIATTLGINGSF